MHRTFGWALLVVSAACMPASPGRTGSASEPQPQLQPRPEVEPPLHVRMELEPDVDLRAVATLSRAEVSEDVRWLLEALRKAWGGRGAVEPEQLEAFESKLAALAESDDAPSSSVELCTELGRLLETLPDAHFDTMLVGKGRCAPTPVRAGQVGANVGAKGSAWSWSTTLVGDQTVGVLALTRFRSPADPVWAGMMDAIDPAVSATIVDLRGNSGGNDTVAYWVAQAVGGEFVRREGVSITRSQHPIALTLMANSVALSIREASRSGREKPQHLVQARDAFLALREEVLNGEQPRTLRFEPGPAEPLVLPPRSPAPVVVLTDARCGSSCENAVYLFRQLPDTTVIGENTSGAIHTGQAGRLVLPNSKTVVVIATQFVHFADGRFLEKIGFSPDIPVQPGDDAMSVALEHLRSRLLTAAHRGE